MCGIVGAIGQRNVSPILIECLRRLEYRGYDSAGIAIINNDHEIMRLRREGKVSELKQAMGAQSQIQGNIGIAHTRWATHGIPSERNAHPHLSGNHIAVAHNGIIENHEIIKKFLIQQGYQFTSETDSEVIAHMIHYEIQKNKDLHTAVKKALHQLDGAYGIVVMDRRCEYLIAARSGSPLVIGIGIDEHFIASDHLALFPVTQQFILLEEGDIAEVHRSYFKIKDKNNTSVTRPIHTNSGVYDATDKGAYRHYMLKEIHEQVDVIADTLEGRIKAHQFNLSSLNAKAHLILNQVRHIQMVACGTSYHAAFVAKYWFESIAKIPCRVDIASEFRYGEFCIPENCLFITLSQSGETADTLAALQKAKNQNYLGTLSICNVPGASLMRESDYSLMTRAGTEIGVASTKAFTTQLVVLLMLITTLARQQKRLSQAQEQEMTTSLKEIPQYINHMLHLSDTINIVAKEIAEKKHCLFLGRGIYYPIAMEGALKLKEISYIHAEAYAAGELKHGPLALIDDEIPVIVIAPHNRLLSKLKSNIEEVKARGGKVYLFSTYDSGFSEDDSMKVIALQHKITELIAPIIYTIPLQLLAYHVAVIKGTDVDQPRNLAKSVTVE